MKHVKFLILALLFYHSTLGQVMHRNIDYYKADTTRIFSDRTNYETAYLKVLLTGVDSLPESTAYTYTYSYYYKNFDENLIIPYDSGSFKTDITYFVNDTAIFFCPSLETRTLYFLKNDCQRDTTSFPLLNHDSDTTCGFRYVGQSWVICEKVSNQSITKIEFSFLELISEIWYKQGDGIILIKQGIFDVFPYRIFKRCSREEIPDDIIDQLDSLH